MRTHRNYVAFFAGTGRVKVGITANLKKRLSYYRQEATRHDLGYVAIEGGQPQTARVARLVENEICRYLKPYAIARHREWFVMDAEGFMEMVAMTRRFQDSINTAIEAQEAHA